MPLDARKVNRHVTVRTAAGKLRPAQITAVGAGTNVDCKVSGAETFAALAKWSKATPATPGWTRDRKEP
jgi:hypothetical protein